MLTKFHSIHLFDIGGTIEKIVETSSEASLLFCVDSVQLIKDDIKVIGWAVDSDFKLPPISILALSGDSVIAHNESFIARPDVEREIGCEIDTLGFQITIKKGQLSNSQGKFSLLAVLHGRTCCRFYSHQ